jgi:hypothetical protein
LIPFIPAKQLGRRGHTARHLLHQQIDHFLFDLFIVFVFLFHMATPCISSKIYCRRSTVPETDYPINPLQQAVAV